jgi:hypothetical protein
MKRLDKTRDYAMYYPDHIGAHFEQDGYVFDHEGEFMVGHPNQKPLPEKKPQPAEKQPQAPKSKQQQTAAAPVAATEGDDEINLESWLRGEADYPIGDVQRVVKERRHKWCTSKVDLILFLVEDQKIVDAGALRDEFKALI